MMVAAFGMGPWGFCLGTEAQIDFYNLKYILSAIDNRPSLVFSDKTEAAYLTAFNYCCCFNVDNTKILLKKLSSL